MKTIEPADAEGSIRPMANEDKNGPPTIIFPADYKVDHLVYTNGEGILAHPAPNGTVFRGFSFVTDTDPERIKIKTLLDERIIQLTAFKAWYLLQAESDPDYDADMLEGSGFDELFERFIDRHYQRADDGIAASS